MFAKKICIYKKEEREKKTNQRKTFQRVVQFAMCMYSIRREMFLFLFVSAIKLHLFYFILFAQFFFRSRCTLRHDS